MTAFPDFGLLSSILSTLKGLKLRKPTDIQSQALPLLMSGQSVVGIAETGSGKTLTYVLPILHALKTRELENDPVTAERAPRAVVLAPTRELGEQISRVFKSFTHDTRLRVRPALGGATLAQAKRNTADVFEVLLATPGRLMQLIERKMIDLSDVRLLVFDEADQMMDEGFLPATKVLAAACPRDVQLALFSATLSPSVQELINDVFPGVEVVRTAGQGKVTTTLETKNLKVTDGERWPVLERVLANPAVGGTMLFTNTREQCDKLANDLNAAGHRCVVYRGEMDKTERRANLKAFRDGKVELLVSTDLAGRGLDVESVGRVINFHLPKQMQNYIHRAGRTARAGRPGVVINLVTERDVPLISQLGGFTPRFEPRRADATKTDPRKSAGPRAPHARPKGRGPSPESRRP